MVWILKFRNISLITIFIVSITSSQSWGDVMKQGMKIFNEKAGCAACHDAGVAGAPMMGNKGQWEARQAKGYEMLVNNAYNGINGMPAKGLCADCTKEEIGIAVQYMLDTI